MRKAIALLLLPLVGCSMPQAAEKPRGPESPPLVDLTVKKQTSFSCDTKDE